MPSYTLLAELALGHVLAGTLPNPSFPDLLRERAPSRWRWEANFALNQAEAHTRVDDVAACLGKLSFAVLAEAHARLCERSEWITNEKQLARRGGVIGAERLLLDMPRRLELTATVNAVRAALRDNVDRAPGDVAS
jgi:hypothetical protein